MIDTNTVSSIGDENVSENICQFVVRSTRTELNNVYGRLIELRGDIRRA